VQGGDRRDVDNRAALAVGDHPLDGRTGGEVDPFHVDREDAPKLLLGHPRQEEVREDAGVVQEHVEAPHVSTASAVVASTPLDRETSAAIGRPRPRVAQLRGDLYGIGPAIGEDDGRPGLARAARAREAEAFAPRR
jgi:hypothetical protein